MRHMYSLRLYSVNCSLPQGNSLSFICRIKKARPCILHGRALFPNLNSGLRSGYFVEQLHLIRGAGDGDAAAIADEGVEDSPTGRNRQVGIGLNAVVLT